jgi:hypothetical protein
VSKFRTLAQVATAKKRAVTFTRSVLEDDDRADEIEEESLQDYAERKGITIVENPGPVKKKSKKAQKGRLKTMAGNTKAELEGMMDQVCTIASDALDPASTRKELVEALQGIYDIVGPEDENDDDDDEEADDDDDE